MHLGARHEKAVRCVVPMACRRAAARSWASRCRCRTCARTRTAAARSRRRRRCRRAVSSSSGLVPARSVPCLRSTWNCSGVSASATPRRVAPARRVSILSPIPCASLPPRRSRARRCPGPSAVCSLVSCRHHSGTPVTNVHDVSTGSSSREPAGSRFSYDVVPGRPGRRPAISVPEDLAIEMAGCAVRRRLRRHARLHRGRRLGIRVGRPCVSAPRADPTDSASRRPGCRTRRPASCAAASALWASASSRVVGALVHRAGWPRARRSGLVARRSRTSAPAAGFCTSTPIAWSRRQRLQLAELQGHAVCSCFLLVDDLQLDDPGALRLAGLVEVDAHAAVVVGRDEVVDAGEGDLGVFLRQALDGDPSASAMRWRPAAIAASILGSRSSLRGAGLGAARRVAGADIGLGGVAVLEVLRDEALVARREGAGSRRSCRRGTRAAARLRFPPLRMSRRGFKPRRSSVLVLRTKRERYAMIALTFPRWRGKVARSAGWGGCQRRRRCFYEIASGARATPIRQRFALPLPASGRASAPLGEGRGFNPGTRW